MAKLGDIVIAKVECPSCHNQIEVNAGLDLKSQPKNVAQMAADVVPVSVHMTGVYVSHDCRKKPKTEQGEPE